MKKRTVFISSIDVGVLGDYKEAKIFVRKSTTNIVTGIYDSLGANVFSTEMPLLSRITGVSVVAVRAWATRLYFVEVFAYNDATLCGPTNR